MTAPILQTIASYSFDLLPFYSLWVFFLNKIMSNPSAHDLLSDCQYGFQKGWSTGDLVFLIESWSSSFRDFGEIFAVGLDISKAFDRVWHKFKISKLPSYGYYPSLCTFISSFLSDRSVAAVVGGHCSSLKIINSGVSQGSVLSPTLFLLFINDDTILYFSTSCNRRPSQQKLSDSRRDAIRRLTSDLSRASDWGRTNPVLFNASKLNFYNYLLDKTIQITIPSSSMTLNCLSPPH